MKNDDIPREQKIYELSLIWKEAAYNFAFWDRLSQTLDWDQAYREALSAVLKTTNLYEYYLELMKFISLLRDGHTRIWFPESIAASPEYGSKLPIRIKYIDGKHIITNVKHEVAHQVKRWSVIQRIDGIDIDPYIEQNIYPYIWHEKPDSVEFWVHYFLRSGVEGSVVTLELEYDGTVETVTLTRTYGDTDWAYDTMDISMFTSEPMEQIYSSDSHRIAFTQDNIAVITMDTMMNNSLPDDFYGNHPLLAKARGYIIDIRSNGGGNSDHADAVAAAFIGGEFTNQRTLHPIHIGAYKAWGKLLNFEDKTYEQIVSEYGNSEWIDKCYRICKHTYWEDDISTYTGDAKYDTLTAPLVVLTSAKTASAAEDFLIGLDTAKRATFVGTASYGSTGQPIIVALESGGSCYICTRHSLYPDGREFINIGVRPHVPCELTLDDYQQGIDSVMNQGLEVIRGLL